MMSTRKPQALASHFMSNNQNSYHMKKIIYFLTAVLLLVACGDNDSDAPLTRKNISIELLNEVPVAVYPNEELDFSFSAKYLGGLSEIYAMADGNVIEESRKQFADSPDSAIISFSYTPKDEYAGNTIDFAVVAKASDEAEGHYDYPVFVLAAKPEIEFTYPEQMPEEFMVDGSPLNLDIIIDSKNIDIKKITTYKEDAVIPALTYELESGIKRHVLHFSYTPTLGDSGAPIDFSIEVMDVNGNLVSSSFSITFTKKASLELNEYSGIVMGLNKNKTKGQFFDSYSNIVYKANGVGQHCGDIDWVLFWSGNSKTIGVAIAAPSTVNVASIYPEATIVKILGGQVADIPANWAVRNETSFREVELDGDGYAAVSTTAEIQRLYDSANVPADEHVLFKQTAGSTIAFKTSRKNGTDEEGSKYGLIRITAKDASNNTGSVTFDYKITK